MGKRKKSRSHKDWLELLQSEDPAARKDTLLELMRYRGQLSDALLDRLCELVKSSSETLTLVSIAAAAVICKKRRSEREAYLPIIFGCFLPDSEIGMREFGLQMLCDLKLARDELAPSQCDLLKDVMLNDLNLRSRIIAASLLYQYDERSRSEVFEVLLSLSEYDANDWPEFIEGIREFSKATLRSLLNPYKKLNGDTYCGVTIDLEGLELDFSRDDLISFLSQGCFRLSKKMRRDGYLNLEDGQLIRPKSPREFMAIAHTVTPETNVIWYPSSFNDGFKIVLADRLIIIRNQTNRYVYDCGRLPAWRAFWQADFSKFSAEDIYFVWYVFMQSEWSAQPSGAECLQQRLTVIRQVIKQFNAEEAKHFERDATGRSRKRFDPSWAERLDDFFRQEGLDIVTAVSYHDISVALTTEILEQRATQSEVTEQFRALVFGDTTISVTLRHIPLLVAATMIAEQGRSYYSVPIALMLSELIGSDWAMLATKKPVEWWDVVASSEVFIRSRLKAELAADQADNKVLQQLADTAGYLPMTHTGSFIKDSVFGGVTEGGYLKHAFGAGTLLSSALVGNKLYALMKMLQGPDGARVLKPGLFKRSKKPVLSRDKTMLILSEWLLYHASTAQFEVKVYGVRDWNRRKKSKDYVPGGFRGFARILWPFIVGVMTGHKILHPDVAQFALPKLYNLSFFRAPVANHRAGFSGLSVQSTRMDGNCLLHALFGQFDHGEHVDAHAQTRRDDLASRLIQLHTLANVTTRSFVTGFAKPTRSLGSTVAMRLILELRETPENLNDESLQAYAIERGLGVGLVNFYRVVMPMLQHSILREQSREVQCERLRKGILRFLHKCYPTVSQNKLLADMGSYVQRALDENRSARFSVRGIEAHGVRFSYLRYRELMQAGNGLIEVMLNSPEVLRAYCELLRCQDYYLSDTEIELFAYFYNVQVALVTPGYGQAIVFNRGAQLEFEGRIVGTAVHDGGMHFLRQDSGPPNAASGVALTA